MFELLIDRRSCLSLAIGDRHQTGAAIAALPSVQEYAVGGRAEVAGRRAATGELIALAPDRQEGLLQEIVRVRRVAGQAIEKAEEGIALLIEKKAQEARSNLSISVPSEPAQGP